MSSFLHYPPLSSKQLLFRCIWSSLIINFNFSLFSHYLRAFLCKRTPCIRRVQLVLALLCGPFRIPPSTCLSRNLEREPSLQINAVTQGSRKKVLLYCWQNHRHEMMHIVKHVTAGQYVSFVSFQYIQWRPASNYGKYNRAWNAPPKLISA